jgi:hypothetical protein
VTDWRTDSMEQDVISEAKDSVATKGIPHLLRAPKAFVTVFRSTLQCIPFSIRGIHMPLCFFEIQFNIMSPPILRWAPTININVVQTNFPDSFLYHICHHNVTSLLISRTISNISFNKWNVSTYVHRPNWIVHSEFINNTAYSEGHAVA